MLKNYIKIAVRNIKKHKIYSIINLLGLVIGITTALFILFWINDELSYDTFHDKADRIYRITQAFSNVDKEMHQTQSSGILAPTLMKESSEVELVTRVRGYREGTIITAGDKKLHEIRHGMADESFFKVFSFPLISGNSKTILSQPNTVAISQSAAAKYFGSENPIGKIIKIYDYDLMVTGIYEDMPPNSHFHFDLLYSVATVPRYSEPHWGLNVFKNYALLRKGASLDKLRKDLSNIVKIHHFESADQYEKYIAKGKSTSYRLMSLKDIHLKSHILWEFEANGNADYVKYFSFIALFIFIIAIVNYINLSTARSASRAREVGIRKTIGSTRFSLIRQFMVEAILTSIVAMFLSIFLIQILLPVFRILVGKPWLQVPYFENPLYLVVLMLLSIIIGIIAGSYPSLVLSSFKPISVLKGRFSSGKRGIRLRNVLVIFQFSMSIILLVGTMIVQKQMNFIQNKNIGFNREQVVVINTFGEIGDKLSIFKEQLLNNPAIIAASASTSIPGKGFSNRGTHLEGTDKWGAVNIIAVDEDFMEVMQLKMSKGRFFSKDMATDDQAVIINESTVKMFAQGNLLSKRFEIWVSGLNDLLPYHVIGIAKDFHYESFYKSIDPMQLILANGKAKWEESYLSIRVHPENIRETVNYINNVWNDLIPGSPFEFTFLDSIYNQLYRNEDLTRNVFSLFTFFALFVSCLGLLGLSSFAAQQRTKEIGIRKVFGATIQGLVLKQSAHFLLWIIVANIFAWPIAWFVMNNWLQNFAFHTDISWISFILSALIVIAIALITVSIQFTKVALVNPIKSLRYE